jgi:hypothetical protein
VSKARLARRARTSTLLTTFAAALAFSCAPRVTGKVESPREPPPLLPDVRTAPGRPPVVLVSRDGDPATAIALAVTTTGIAGEGSDDPEAATALAALVEARLKAHAVDALVTPSWDGVRASMLAATELDAARIADALREITAAPATAAELAPVRRKLTLLAQRPLRDKALARWARCVGEPHAPPERAGKDYADLDVAKVERWRAGALGTGRIAVAVTGSLAASETVASTILSGPPWKEASPLGGSTEARTDPAVDVFEMAGDASATPLVNATLDVGTSSAAVTTASALGDPRGPLAARLAELDLPFRLRSVTGTANARGGCVGVVLEAAPSAPSSGDVLASRVADAVALVQIEASVHLAESGSRDGRVLARRAGDAREAAELAAWWALVPESRLITSPKGATPMRMPSASIALGMPSRRGAKEATVEPSRETLAAAVARASTAWERPVVEARARIEAGQGEAWLLLASPCGTEGEGDSDSGLTAIFATAVADAAKVDGDVRIEPWVVADGAGVLVHGPALANETPVAHLRRLADIAARSFEAEPITAQLISRARADLLSRDARNDGGALSVLASALAPQHPSWVVPWGASEPLARSSDAAIIARAQALRAGPLRVAVLANDSASQADAAVRAADRWVARRASETRTCRAVSTAQPQKPGTYAVAQKPGAVPEAYLAFPFAPGDDAEHRTAQLVAAALEDGGLLEHALGGPSPLAHESSARVLGWPRAPALVVRIAAPQASLDAAVMQTRSLLDRVRGGGLAGPDLERAATARSQKAISSALDPRARVVATWRDLPPDGSAVAKTTQEAVRAFAQKRLSEDSMIVVAARPPRRPSGTP